MKLGIIPKLTLVFVIFAAVLIASLGLLVFRNARSSLQTANISGLLSTALEKETALDAWVEERQDDTAAIAASPHLRDEVMRLRSAAPDSEEARAAYDRLVAGFAPYVKPQGVFLEVMALDPETGEVLVSTNPAEKGKFKENRPYFINGRDGSYVQNVYYSITLQAPAMTASAPIRSEDGSLLAVLAARLNLEEMNAIIARHTGLHQSDEAFLVNTSSLFVTQPRLIPDPAVLQRGVHTEAVDRCLERSSGVISALDYRGNPALIVYRWLPERQLCLITKIDQAEALAPANALRGTIFTVSGFILILASVLAYGLARSITSPIRALQDGTARFGRGELEKRIPITTHDELGKLAVEFNAMADALMKKEEQLRGHAAQLEKMVEERTASLREKEYLLSEAQRIAHIGSWDVNLAIGEIIWSEEMYRIYGISPEAFGHTTQAFVELIHPADREAVQGWIGRLLSGMKGEQHEFRVQQANGTVRHIRGSGEAILNEAGVPVRAIGAAQDITEHKQAEDEIRQLNAELEQRVAERTSELRAANKELEAFAYSVSHDLRAPLRAIDGFSQALLSKFSGQLGEAGEHYLVRVRENTRRMGQLIDDLLTLSRVSRQEMSRQPVDLMALANEIAVILRDSDPQRKVRFKIAEQAIVEGDAGLLKVTLQNLLENAWKFTAPREFAEIEVGFSENGSERVFHVRDNGVGFDMQYTDKLFGAFQRLHSIQEFPGTGIGLATVQRVIHRHGGRIWTEAAVNEGATFYFTLGADS